MASESDNLDAIEAEIRRRMASGHHMAAEDLAHLARAARDVETGRAEQERRKALAPLFMWAERVAPMVANLIPKGGDERPA